MNALGPLDDHARKIAATLLDGCEGNADTALMLVTLVSAELMRIKQRTPRPAPKMAVGKA